MVWKGSPSTRHLFAGPTIWTSFTPGYLWSNPVAVADLLQLWTDVQGAAGGGARVGLNWDLTAIKVSIYNILNVSYPTLVIRHTVLKLDWFLGDKLKVVVRHKNGCLVVRFVDLIIVGNGFLTMISHILLRSRAQ